MSSTKKTHVVYFGNKLKKSRNVNTVMETLEPLLADFVSIHTCSDQVSKPLRALDFLVTFFSRGLRANLIMIDVFSTLNFYFAVAISLLSFLFRKKFILFLHGGNLPYRYKQSQKIFHFILSHAHAIIAPSDYLKLFFEEQGYKVQLIPNFIHIGDYHFRTRPSSPPVILYMRGFSTLYNPQLLIRALSILKKQLPESRTYMIGKDIDGTLAVCKQLAAENNLSDQIVFMPALPKNEWLELSKNCTMMVSVPAIDNTPVSMIEGMALGLPVISTNVGGIRYLIEHNKTGILIEHNQEQQLADAILYLSTHPEAGAAMATAAREKAEHYDWKKIRTRWQKLLNV
jgi:glycosyltransferase involved in cell wall biosynthesis